MTKEQPLLSASHTSRWHLRLAAQVLQGGGVVLHATESVWGLACDPHNHQAVAQVLALKQRDVSKGLLLIGATADDFAAELAPLTAPDHKRVMQTWPGGVSWLLPNREYPVWVTGKHSSVGVRVPGHTQARALCAAFGGALVSTSANISGHAAPRGVWQAQRAMGQRVDYVLPGAVGGAAKPSKILSLQGQQVR